VRPRSTLLGVLAIVVAIVGWWLATGTDSPSRARTTASGGLGTIAIADLPPEGRRTLDLIEAGGPYPYDRDGVVFENRERILPAERRGYYHEYTVPTPGSDDRGARRIVAGSAGERYYSDDHYASFRRIGG
jgi:ribonuclease T1